MLRSLMKNENKQIHLKKQIFINQLIPFFQKIHFANNFFLLRKTKDLYLMMKNARLKI
jgi:hypothetical protein